MKIQKPGIYDIPISEYREEPCAAPSISSGGLRKLLLDCPAKYWWHSPLNPDRPDDEKPIWNIGTGCHDMIVQGDLFWEFNAVLAPEMLKANGHLTDEGLAFEAEAKAAGKNVLRPKQFELVKQMRDAFFRHDFAKNAFINGAPEKTLAWQDEETGVWLRCRPDFLPTAMRFIPDYKTAVSAKPADFMRQVYNLGYHMQAALYLDGIEVVTGHAPESFFFVVQEKEPPYVVSVIALDHISIEWGRIQNRKAIHTFAQCLKTGVWPGYETEVVEGALPIYAERELERLHERGRFDTRNEEAA